METISTASVTFCYVDNNCSSGGEDLIWVTVEPLCCILETNIRLTIIDTSIKKVFEMENIP